MIDLNSIKQSILGEVQKVGQGFKNQKTIQPQDNFVSQFGRSPVGKSIVNLQNFLESPKSISLPQVPNRLNPTVPVGIGSYRIPIKPVQLARDIINVPFSYGANALSDMAVNTGRTIRGDQLLNYNQVKSPATRLGYNISQVAQPQNTQGYNINNNVQNWLGNAAGTIEGPLSVYGGGKLFGLGKTPMQIAEQGFRQAVIKGVKQGAAFGGSYGVVSGLKEGREDTLSGQLLKAGQYGLGGVVAGGVLGGGLAGASNIFNKLKLHSKYSPSLVKELNEKAAAQPRDPVTQQFVSTNLKKPKGMPEAQWKYQLDFNKRYNRNPYQPVYSSDLKKAVDYEIEKKGVGLSIRDINKDKNPLNDVLPIQKEVQGQPLKSGVPNPVQGDLQTNQMPQSQQLNESVNPSTFGKEGQKLMTIPPKIPLKGKAGQSPAVLPEGTVSGQNPSLANNRPSEGIVPQGISVQASPKLMTKINKVNLRLNARQAQREMDEWQRVVADQTGARTTKEAVDDVARLINESTETAQKVVYVTSQKTGNVITNRAKSKIERTLIDSTANWKDKPRLSYTRERLDRNIEDIAGKDAPRFIEKYFKPVQRAEAERMRWLNKERAEIKNLGIKGGSAESKALQQYGEGKLTLDQLKKELPSSWQKVANAEKVFRSKYDRYLVDINKTLVKNGYDPIPKRKDYFLHFQEINNVLERFGIPVRDNTLPTDISGLSADFKPGKNFFSSALQRKGDMTDLDAVQGIDRYLEGASKQIFHTDNIQNLRLFEKAIRDKYAGTTHLSNFVADLGEYVNNLSGKKAMIDRAAEALLGRNVYGAAQRLRQQTGANMVGANVASSLTNYIPLTQAAATTSKPSFIKGMLGAMRSTFKNDGFSQQSDFLTRRLGSDRLYVNKWDTIAQKGGWLFKTIDRFVSETITRGKYHEGISKGLTPKQALNQADDYASRLMGDRSLGSMPTLFTSQTAGFLTQFQLEVNNQLSFMFKDLPRSSQSNAAYASALGQVFLYSYLYNNLYENFFGRRPAFDPLGVAQNAIEDYTNPNMKKGQATKNLTENVTNQLPFSSILTGGRIPVGSVIPNPVAALTGESSWQKELTKPLTILPPTGGSQIKKTLEGFDAFMQGASISPAGRVRYPIEQTPQNFLRTVVGGQYSTPDANAYFREGRTPLGDKQTEAFRSSDNPQGVYSQIMTARKSNKSDDEIKQQFEGGGQGIVNDKLYYNDNGSVKSFDLTPPYKGEGIKSFVNSDWKEKQAAKLWNTEGIDQKTKNQIFKKWGIDPKDAEYAALTSFNSDISAQYIESKSPDHETLLQNIISGRVVGITGKQFADNAVIDRLVDMGQLSKQEASYLKKVKLIKKDGKITQKLTGRVAKGKKISLAGLKKPVSDIKLKSYKTPTVKLATRSPKVKVSNVSFDTPFSAGAIPQAPNFKTRIKFNV